MKIDKQQHGTVAPMAATTVATTEAPTAATSTVVLTASVLRVAPPIGFAHVKRPLQRPATQDAGGEVEEE